MFDEENQDAAPQKELKITPNMQLFAVCRHGNGRSKHIARVLEKLGYRETNICGTLNFPIKDKDLANRFKNSKVFFSASPDVTPKLTEELKKLGIFENVSIVELNLGARLHDLSRSITRGDDAIKARAMNELHAEIKNQLLAKGIRDLSK